MKLKVQKTPKDYHTPMVSIIINGSNELESKKNRTEVIIEYSGHV